jgi:hypothetical protein
MQKSYSRLVRPGIVVLVLLVTLWTVKLTLLHGASVVSLSSEPALYGQVSQALISANTPVLKPNKDYRLQVKYFSSNNWAVATILPNNNSLNQGVIILQKQSGVFKVVLGPGSSFPRPILTALPDDVATYLKEQGYING